MKLRKSVPKEAQLPICLPLYGTEIQWGVPDSGVLSDSWEAVIIRGGERCTYIWRIYIMSTSFAQCEYTTHVQVLSHTLLSSTMKVYLSLLSGTPPIPLIHMFHLLNTQDILLPSNQVLPLPLN